MFKRHVLGAESICAELRLAAALLDRAWRDWCASVVVNSNHDRALERWVVEADYKKDPKNARFYLEATAAWYKAIDEKNDDFLLTEHCISAAGLQHEVQFLRRDESCVIKDIEHGYHGDDGPNGARATAANLSNLGRKMNVGHTHTAEIHDSVYIAGTFSELNLDYNHGPSSWSHSFIVVYRNGKRAIVTLQPDGRWRVPRLPESPRGQGEYLHGPA